MMVLMAKLPSKLLPLANVYCPTAQVHAANDAPTVRGYKHMTGISRHAHTDALLGPWEHGCQGLTRSSHSWLAAVACEWVHQGAWAKEDFRESRTCTLQAHQALTGDALPYSPQDNTPTIRGAPTSSVRCSGWWMRYPCPCGCRTRARGRPPYWCGALADQERGQWRPPPPRWRCTPRNTPMSRK